MRDSPVFRDDHDAIADVVERVIGVLWFSGGTDDAVVANASILVDDGVFDTGVFADTDFWPAGGCVFLDRSFGFEVIAAEKNGAMKRTACINQAANADDTMLDLGMIDYAAI